MLLVKDKVFFMLLLCYSANVPKIALLHYWPAVKTASYIKTNTLQLIA